MSYVLLFRTHFWDEFTQRAFDRMRERAPGGDVYVAADETKQPVPCPPEIKLPHSVDRFLSLGLSAHPENVTMWYNGDYPMYSALIDLPRYDYYILAEFDVVIGANLDQTIEQLQRMGGDAVTAYMHKAPPDWVWTKTADEIYPEVYGSLNPVLILSRRAVSNLYYARLAQSHRWATSRLKQWPYCEAFIASQLKHAKLQVHELAEFGPTEHLSWWPPMEERLVLEQLGGQAFVHPVLAGDAYLRSLARYDTSGGPGTAVQRDKEAWDAEFARLKDLHSRGLQPV